MLFGVTRALGSLLGPAGQSWPLTEQVRIGRAESADIRIDDTAVSREHAVIRHNGDRWTVEDCGSRNGTRVNDARIPNFVSCALRDGDRLMIGRLTLRVALADAADTDVTSSLVGLTRAPALSPYQLQVIRLLAEPWLRGTEPATNAEIAARLGTPQATEAVKAALRRCYVKAGVADLPTHTKRRELCRLASERGWI
jgi:pSer/pThr/pTyr-binding forkhead associated (FHA) protein